MLSEVISRSFEAFTKGMENKLYLSEHTNLGNYIFPSWNSYNFCKLFLQIISQDTLLACIKWWMKGKLEENEILTISPELDGLFSET